MDKKAQEDYKKNFDSKAPIAKYIMINGRTITLEEYRSNPTYYNNLPIEPSYLKRVQDDYESNQ